MYTLLFCIFTSIVFQFIKQKISGKYRFITVKILQSICILVSSVANKYWRPSSVTKLPDRLFEKLTSTSNQSFGSDWRLVLIQTRTQIMCSLQGALNWSCCLEGCKHVFKRLPKIHWEQVYASTFSKSSSRSVRVTRCDVPFCGDVLLDVCLEYLPRSPRKLKNSVLVFSLPPSVWNTLSLDIVCPSNRVRNYTERLKTLFIALSRYSIVDFKNVLIIASNFRALSLDSRSSGLQPSLKWFQKPFCSRTWKYSGYLVWSGSQQLRIDINLFFWSRQVYVVYFNFSRHPNRTFVIRIP